jgi:hypothetical protein
MWKFIQFELKYWLKTPMVWIFLFINTLLVFFAVASEYVTIGGGIGNTHKNAPFVIEQYYGVFSTICLLMTTAFMNATANRDFQYGMYQFIFTSPIKKREAAKELITLDPQLELVLNATDSVADFVQLLMNQTFKKINDEKVDEEVSPRSVGSYLSIENSLDLSQDGSTSYVDDESVSLPRSARSCL